MNDQENHWREGATDAIVLPSSIQGYCREVIGFRTASRGHPLANEISHMAEERLALFPPAFRMVFRMATIWVTNLEFGQAGLAGA